MDHESTPDLKEKQSKLSSNGNCRDKRDETMVLLGQGKCYQAKGFTDAVAHAGACGGSGGRHLDRNGAVSSLVRHLSRSMVVDSGFPCF